MALTTLTAGDDTVYLYEGLLAGINNRLVDLMNATLDGAAGTDTLVVYDYYPSSNFTLTTSTAGVATLATASGSISLTNFERIQFANTSLTLATPVSTTPTTGNDSITGTSGNDNIAALAGNDTVSAGAGNDTLDGGSGTDSLTGGLGSDTYVVDSLSDVITEAAGTGTGKDLVKVAIATTSGTYTLAANAENAMLTSTVAYNLTGNDLANVLTGNAADNVFSGEMGRDTVSYANSTTTTGITASLATNTATGFGADSFASIENLTGSRHSDTLTGNGAANVLDGGAGSDNLIGGSGNDTYVIDSLSDVITEAAGTGAGKDLVKVAIATASGTYALPANVENATLTSTVAYNLTGNSQANVLTGNAAANVLNGGAGIDKLMGGLGSDTFVFNTALNATIKVDTIGDYDSGGDLDRIFLDDAVFSALEIAGSTSGVALNGTVANASKFCLGTQAAGVEDRIIYDQPSGNLYYDPTGSINGASDQVLFAVVGMATHPVLDAGDFFFV